MLISIMKNDSFRLGKIGIYNLQQETNCANKTQQYKAHNQWDYFKGINFPLTLK